MTQRIVVHLAISPEQYQVYYSGQIRQVVASTSDGRTVRFPANILQKVISHEGIYGWFAIEFDHQGRFVQIYRVDLDA